MRTGVKVAFVIGGILLVAGGLFAVRGLAALSELEGEDTFTLVKVRNGTITIEDVDEKGDVGVTFFVEGKYEDNNLNRIWDHCENTNVTIISVPETNSDWDENRSGNFYYDVNYEGDFEGCEVHSENKNFDRESLGLIRLGHACLACHAGNISFESDNDVWVQYDDPLIEELGAGFLQFGVGACSCLCSLIVLIVGVIALVSATDSVEDMPVIINAHGNMVVTQPSITTPIQSEPPKTVLDDKTESIADAGDASENSEWFN